MIAAKINDPDLGLIKQRYRRLKKHYEELSRIRKAENKYGVNRSQTIKPKVGNSAERLIEINRVNRILLAKIQTIGNRKQEATKPVSKSLRTLNMPLRKMNAVKIYEENEQMASRISGSKPLILKEKFEKDYLLHQRYVNQLSKKRMLKFQESYWGRIENELKSVTPTVVDNNKGYKSFYRSGNMNKNSRSPGVDIFMKRNGLGHDFSFEDSSDSQS